MNKSASQLGKWFGPAVVSSMLAFSLLLAAGPSLGREIEATQMRMKIGSNKCMSKGGIGIVHLDLYIDLGSKANELILANGNRWKGANSGEAQVLFVLDGEVIAEPTAKKDFKLERSVVVSFEQDKVSFFDFGAGTGGYYERVRR